MKSKVEFCRTSSDILLSQCKCKAGNGHCSHGVGLLYLLCHYLRLGLKAVPPMQSKTSLPQTWHVPQRIEGLEPKPVHSLEICKVNPKKQPPKKKRRVTEGVLPNIYCPVKTIPCVQFKTTLLEQLTAMKSDAQILRILSTDSSSETESLSKFGPVPKGSVLSYQQKPHISVDDIINHNEQQEFPDLLLPEQPRHYNRVLNNAEHDGFMGMHIDRPHALELEEQTRLQSVTKLWHNIRRHRLTSTMFKDICARRADHEKLAVRLLKSKNIQTVAMKFGLQNEPEAAKLYSDITGNNVYLCGFVINPSSPHLGASPDRKIYDPNSASQYGLLEIKCPDKDSFQECAYLKRTNDGTYKLKHSHQYYYQVMGQMALTGLHWCDFFVKCRQDYHKERINFNEEKWEEIKLSLDRFYFNYFLPEIVRMM
ncbi:uncharacterized protein LOC125653246 [Ostrea edulis]|uniref:uncharacterized protein LOC125653246 n=1 Tax=Ostrea edulis TaxID=37623 RepID=UPI0024AEEE9D|nr:uncharacterized protein LOC125653246 [Ostrea edulis]